MTFSGRKVNITAWSPDSRWVSSYLDLPWGETRGHVVTNVSTGEARALNDDSDGRTLFYAARQVEANIRMVERDTARTKTR